MRASSLVGQLLRVHLLVVALACGLLVAGALGGSALLLRWDQDQSLRAVALAVCRAIADERLQMRSTPQDLAPELEELREAATEGYRLELFDEAGQALAARGELPGWPGQGAAAARSEGCVTHGPGGGWSDPPSYRACTTPCSGASRLVRVTTRDVLARPEVRRAALGILVALPLAVLVGAFAGVAMFRRLLRPLDALRRAATRLEPRPGVALGVGARPAELSSLESAFDHLLHRLGEALAREKRFTQEASHELRTPLTILRGRLERLGRAGLPAGELRMEAAAALDDVDSLDKLVEALLVLARSDSAPLLGTPVNLCDLAREVAAQQLRAGDASPAAPQVDAPDEVLVKGSEELLVRALGNLVENSRKFAGDRGAIRITVRAVEGRGVITVEDDGPGIPAELRPFVFERFVRGPGDRNRVPGAGLGLAVVRAIVARHGGTVSTGPGAPGGERMEISLPLLATS